MAGICFRMLEGPHLFPSNPQIIPHIPSRAVRIYKLQPDFMKIYGQSGLPLRLVDPGHGWEVESHLGQKTWDKLVARNVISEHEGQPFLYVRKLQALVSEPDFLSQVDLKLRNPQEDANRVAEIICARILPKSRCLVDKYGMAQAEVIRCMQKWFISGDFGPWNNLLSENPNMRFDLSGLDFSGIKLSKPSYVRSALWGIGLFGSSSFFLFSVINNLYHWLEKNWSYFNQVQIAASIAVIFTTVIATRAAILRGGPYLLRDSVDLSNVNCRKANFNNAIGFPGAEFNVTGSNFFGAEVPFEMSRRMVETRAGGPY